MKLGFVSAIFPEFTLEQVLAFAAETGFSSVELMCWPPGKAERKYAGVTHFDPSTLDSGGIKRVREQVAASGVEISGLGYYPNPLSSHAEESETAIRHLGLLIDAAPALGVTVVNSFIGRDPSKSVEANWPRFLEVWRPLVQRAEQRGVRIGIENCPMLFTLDEWPGGKNLATSPAIWRKMFEAIPSPAFGLNFDPSHMIWQQMDYLAPLTEFRDRLVHLHAKDARIDREAARCARRALASEALAHAQDSRSRRCAARGALFGALSDAGYDGHVAIEVEDKAFQGSLEKRKESLVISRRFLLQYMAG